MPEQDLLISYLLSMLSTCTLTCKQMHTHAQTAAERLMIFTLINTVNKACRGRIYTQDYIGGVVEEEKKKKGVSEGEKITKKEGGGGVREQAFWLRDTQSLMEESRDSSGIT